MLAASDSNLLVAGVSINAPLLFASAAVLDVVAGCVAGSAVAGCSVVSAGVSAVDP